MLQELLSSAAGPLAKELIGKFNIPNDKVDDTVKVAGGEIMEGLKGEALSGNIGGIVELFQGKANLGTHPIVSKLVKELTSGLAQKVGLSPEMANQVSQFAVPFILQHLTKSTAASGGEVDEKKVAEMFGGDIAKDILGKLGGGNLGSMLGGFFK